ncbi:PAS domain-containing sensor histidine kinase [Plebeiibacterium sediminum]|uniref:histidine kinase n=1 Tax=Plebeiibacterium sediminum TaxID=2992112 RepID=A0AAE3SDG7_9BACT|nr:PAS domain-containing sensor histidine kinase [Plebeiobacterium sediminum]MCW3785383.1 PAS domain-containing sensor histidine kinase [Plebeiobacterium sediminum]
MENDWDKYRDKIIGLGEHSLHKSYYPELQKKIDSLEASQNNLQTILNSISDAIIIHDPNGRILSINDQTQAIYNINKQECNKYTVFDITSPEQDTSNLRAIWDDVIGNKPHIFEWIAKPVNSHSEIEIQVSVSPTLWNNQSAIVAVLRDFTERKKFEHELILAKEKAEKADQLKTEFLKNMSHEIRTPMNGIMGFSEMLTEKDLPEDLREYYAKIVQENSSDLLRIIDDILEISKLVAKQISVNKEVFCLNELLIRMHAEYTLMSKNDQVPIRIKDEIKHCNFRIYSDKIKLTKVMQKLLENAIKFTDMGFIELGYTISGDELVLYVKDTGIGIYAKNREIIFERFSKVNKEPSRSGGLGLGLAISHEYAKLLEGAITIDSEVGKGSTFYFKVPYKKN